VVKHAGVEEAQVEVSEEGGRLSNAVLDRGQGTRATNEALSHRPITRQPVPLQMGRKKE